MWRWREKGGTSREKHPLVRLADVPRGYHVYRTWPRCSCFLAQRNERAKPRARNGSHFSQENGFPASVSRRDTDDTCRIKTTPFVNPLALETGFADHNEWPYRIRRFVAFFFFWYSSVSLDRNLSRSDELVTCLAWVTFKYT